MRGRIGMLTRQMRKFPLGQDRYTRQYWNLPEMGGVLIEGQETSSFEYLEELLPRLEAEERERNREAMEGVAVSPPHSCLTTESHGNTSDVPLSTQSSPRPGGAWFTDSPAKYSDETDVDVMMTPTKVGTPLKAATPTRYPTIYEETSSDQSSIPPSSPLKEAEPVPEKTTQHPLEISAKHDGHVQEQVAMETNPPPSSLSSITETVVNPVTTPPPLSNSSPSIVTTFSSHKATPSHTPVKSATPSSHTPVKSATPSSHTPVKSATPPKTATSSLAQAAPWFSLLPRKPCELLHYINGGGGDLTGSASLLNGGGGGANQLVIPGGYTAYMTQDGTTVLATTGQQMMQQVQMGYAVMGNTLVPQTQYIIQSGGTTPGAAVGGHQYVSLPNGQIAALATGADPSNTNIQYTSIGGNQYAIIQQPAVEERVGGVNTPTLAASASRGASVNSQVVGAEGGASSEGIDSEGGSRKRKRKKAKDTIQPTGT